MCFLLQTENMVSEKKYLAPSLFSYMTYWSSVFSFEKWE